jgi:hypothetical protein
MSKKKIVIVVADGRVETVFANEDVDVEIVDFDGLISEGEQQEAGDYVDACRATMKEISC